MRGSCGNLEDIFAEMTYIFTTLIIINNSELSLFLVVSSSIPEISQLFDNTHIFKYVKYQIEVLILIIKMISNAEYYFFILSAHIPVFAKFKS